MPTGDEYRVTMKYVFADSIGWNVLHFRNDGLVGGLLEVATELQNNWNVQIRTIQPSNVKTYAIRVHQINPIGPAPIEKQIVNTPGNAAGEPLPPQLALVIRLRTAMYGRSRMGRFYLCGPSGNWLTLGAFGGQWGPGIDTVVNNLKNMYCNPGHAQYRNLALLIHSRKLNDTTPVTQLTWDTIPGVQRKRRVGTGI